MNSVYKRTPRQVPYLLYHLSGFIFTISKLICLNLYLEPDLFLESPPYKSGYLQSTSTCLFYRYIKIINKMYCS